MRKIYKKFGLLMLLAVFMILTKSVFAQNIYITTDSTFTSSFTIASGDTLFIASGASYVGTTSGNRNITVNGVIQNEGLLVCGAIEWKNGSGQQTLNGILIALTSLKTHSSVSFTGNGTVYALSTTGTTTNITNGGITLEVAFKSWEGGTSTDWATAANWSGGTLPATTERILISSTATNMPTLNTTAQIRSIVLLSGDELTIGASGALTVDSFLVNNGVVNIQSTAATATGNLFIGKNYSGAGTVNVERHIGDALWHILSSPVVEDLGSFYTNNAYIRGNPTTFDLALGTYDETNNDWSLFNIVSGPLPSGTFEAARAYLISIQNVVDSIVFTGDSIFVGDQSVTLTKNGGGWNGIGNPYTTSLDIAQFLTDNSGKLDATYTAPYVWDASTSDYISTSTGNVAVGQGFLVKALAGDETINFNSGQQVANSGVEFKSASVDAPGLKLNIASSYYRNQTVIAFEKDGRTGMESGLDLGKLKGNPNIALYSKLVDGSMQDVDFYRQSLQNESFETQTIPLGLDLKYASEASFTIEVLNFPEDAKVYLEDAELGIRTLMNVEGAEYKVDLPSLNGSDRFNLVVENFKSGEIATGIEAEKENLLNIYSGNGKIIINGPVSSETQFAVFGIDGRMMTQTMASSTNRNEIDASGYPNGIYLVRIEQPGNLQTQKVIVSNK